jgi:uncharacterized Tic20 family protein
MSSYPTPDTWGASPTTSEERNWALAAHVGSFVTAWFALGLFAPLLVLLIKAKDSPFVRRHAVESLNFQLNALVYSVVFALLLFALVGFVLLPLYGIFYVIVVIIGTVKAGSGEEYRYPLTVRVVT